MMLEMNEQQQMFKSTIEKFVEPADAAALKSSDGIDIQRWGELVDLGLLTCWTGLVSPDLGEMAVSPRDLMVVSEALGYGISPEPWLENGIAPLLIVAAAEKRGLMDDLASGKHMFALGSLYGEKGAGVPVLSRIAGKGGDDTYQLDGDGVLIAGGGAASRFIIPARFDGDPTFCIILSDDQGVTVRPYRLADGKLAVKADFQSVRIDEGSLLGVDGDRLDRVISLLYFSITANLLGITRRLYDESVAYCRQREQFGQPIAQFQAIRHRLVDCHVELELIRGLLIRMSINENDAFMTTIEKAWQVKSYVSTVARRIAQEAVQLHGAIGITDELIIGHGLKRILVLDRLYEEFSPEMGKRSGSTER